MAEVVYTKGLRENLEKVKKADGQILVTEDTGELYIDMSNGTRKKISDKDLVTMSHQVTDRFLGEEESITINDAFPLLPFKVILKQSTIPTTSISENKLKCEYYDDNGNPIKGMIPNGLMQNTWVDLTQQVLVGETAIFSFDKVGDSAITGEFIYFGNSSAEYIGEVTVKETANGRNYIEINNTFEYPIGALKLYVNDEETYLENCALRFDGSTEYVEYEEIDILYDTSEISVIETNSGQSIQANAEGIASGFICPSDGYEMNFKLDQYNSYFTLTIDYKRSLITEINELKAQLKKLIK